MKVVIAEKPSVAIDLARVMNAKERKNGYINGQDQCFTWCYGHLLQLAPPEVYGFKSFSAIHLPMIPDIFRLLPRLDKNGKADAGIVKQIEIIKGLFLKASEIIVATDAGREGELIFRYLYEYLSIQRPLKRLWLSSMTDTAILDAFKQLRQGSDFDRLYYAAKARSEADWLVGMNATQGLTVAVKSQKPLSLGRVQTPTLAMICRRYLEHKHFVPEKFFQVQITLTKTEVLFVATSEKKFQSANQAAELVKAVSLTKSALVQHFEKKEVKENAPLLFDLTTLQQEANKLYSLSADDTLSIAQKLYESKYITYPRTGSRYISDDLFYTIPGLIKVQRQHELFSDIATSLAGQKLNTRSVNSEKVTDHHALLPTENFPSGLLKKERDVYDLIAGRMLEAFSQACIKDVTKVILESAMEKFLASGSIIKIPGWRSVWDSHENPGDDQLENDTEQQQLPELIISEMLPVKKADTLNKQTKPKPIHTEATLLKSMETAGRDTDDEDLKEAMKNKGIGTPATRAATIEILFKRGYIERQKKSLIPTSLGLLVYELVKDKTLSSVELTGAWEHKLLLIEKGDYTAHSFKEEIIQYTRTVTTEMLRLSPAQQQQFDQQANADKLKCPSCQSGHIRIFEKAANCSRSNEGCKFVIFRTIAGKKISEKQINDLIIKGKTALIKGFKSSKNGKEFDAFIILDNNYTTKFLFQKG